MIDNEELELAQPESNNIVPNLGVRWLLYGYIMLIIPVMSMVFSVIFIPEWQSGRSYELIMLSCFITPAFTPFILWPMVSMVLLLYDEKRYANYFWVRWGIYSGVIVGLQYSVLLGLGMLIIPPIIGLISYPIVMGVAYLVDAHVIYKPKTVKLICVSVLIMYSMYIVINIIIVLIIGYNNKLSGVVFWFIPLAFLLISLVSGPIWYTNITFYTSWRLSQHYKEKPMQLLRASIVWQIAYGIAWFDSVVRTVEFYNSLPKYPPETCYIATAAAQGHPKLVGARPVALGEGRVMWVNPQLQYLKAGELILLATWPRGHQQVRRVYDVIGPKIARRLRHPILADMAYITLLPLEWSVRGLLFFSPQLNALAQRLYICE